MSWIITAIGLRTEVPHYWTGTGLSSDSARAETFPTRADAISTWEDHQEAFQGWDGIAVKGGENA